MAGAYSAYCSITKLGIHEKTMNCKVRGLLINSFVRSNTSYGLECVHLSKREIGRILTTDNKIVKRAINVSKYSNSKKVMAALGLEDLGSKLETMRLNFFKRLMENEVTGDLINYLCKMAFKGLWYGVSLA